MGSIERRRSDQKRGAEKPWRRWYGTARWKRLRAEVLRAEPTCRMCRQAPSTVCDHLYLHNGDPLKFWGGPFQALCKRCHDSTKQSMEALAKPKSLVVGLDGWPVETAKPAGWVSRDDLFWPKDLRPSKPELIIVAGAPASGKTTFVEQRAQPGELLIDSDIEAGRLGIAAFTDVWADRVRLLKARNDRLRELSTSNAPRAWYMALLGRPEDRDHFAGLLKPKEVIVINTPADECLHRIRATRPDAPHAMSQTVLRWHRNYRPRAGEQVLRQG